MVVVKFPMMPALKYAGRFRLSAVWPEAELKLPSPRNPFVVFVAGFTLSASCADLKRVSGYPRQPPVLVL